MLWIKRMRFDIMEVPKTRRYTIMKYDENVNTVMQFLASHNYGCTAIHDHRQCYRKLKEWLIDLGMPYLSIPVQIRPPFRSFEYRCSGGVIPAVPVKQYRQIRTLIPQIPVSEY